MILSDNQIDNRIINRMIGESVSFDYNKPKRIGSPSLYLKSFINKVNNNEVIEPYSRCNLEMRAKGILLLSNYSNKQALLPIPENEILEIKIFKGKEKIDPFLLSPMWILLKLGFSIKHARHFKIRLHEYSIEEMKLYIKSEKFDINFIANGYLFERHLSFLNVLGYDKKIIET